MSEDKQDYGTLKTIEKLMAEYYKYGASMQVDELLNIQDKIAIHSYRLAEMAANSKSEYNGLYFIRKITINRGEQALLNKGLSKAAASVQVEATDEAEDRLKGELEAEAEAYKLDLLLKQVNNVLRAINQRISHLKKEHSDKIPTQ